MNIRSIGNDSKSGQIYDFAMQKGFDHLAMIEAWLTSDDRSQQQIDDITGHNMAFHHRPRSGRREGGILLKSSLKIKPLSHGSFKSFEHTEVSVATAKVHVRLIVVYRPVPSTKHGLTVSMFLEEFSTYLESIITSPGHLLILGDFNFHVDCLHDPDATQFLNLLKSYNLSQFVSGTTHKSGHTLDLVILRADDEIVSDVCTFSPCISDHESIIFNF